MSHKTQAGSRLPILMYHEVTDVREGEKKVRETNPEYILQIERFRDQIECIASGGHRTLSLYDVVNGKVKDDNLAITFDDGLAGACRTALRLLGEYGFTATFFVVTDFVGKRGYAGWDLLRELSDKGHSIQSHGASHNPLTEMGTDRLRREVEVSKKTIEDRIGGTVDFLSAPHGMFDRKVRHAALSAGYRGVCTSEPGFSHSLCSPAVFKRINVPDTCSARRFRSILQKERKAILLHEAGKHLKNLLKRTVGYDRYRSLYALRYRIEK